jgi:hypothetical protein
MCGLWRADIFKLYRVMDKGIQMPMAATEKRCYKRSRENDRASMCLLWRIHRPINKGTFMANIFESPFHRGFGRLAFFS